VTVNRLADVFGIDRGTVRRRLADVPAAKVSGGRRYWSLEAVTELLTTAGNKSVPRELREELIHEQIRKLKIRNDKEAGALVARAAVCSAVAATTTGVKGILRRFVQEAPPDLVGLEVPDIRVALKRWEDHLCERFQTLSKHWPE